MVTIAKPRRYYSLRNGAAAGGPLFDLDAVKRMVQSLYGQFHREGYFDEAFGFVCVDSGDNWGTAGDDVEDYVLLHTGKPLWPIAKRLPDCEEADVFDLIEFLYDHVSKPTKGYYHQFAGCGYHWEEFDRTAGQAELRAAVAELLEHYGPGFQMNERGEIMELAPRGMGKLLAAKPPTADKEVISRVSAAVDQFQRYGSKPDDRRRAVRDLADVLEKLRPQVKERLGTQTDKDLFNIANNFGIRHLNDKQRTDYDPVWLSWIFHCYLAAIHACLHLAKRKAS